MEENKIFEKNHLSEKDSKFEDIRPYRDEEVPEAMKRITDSVSFPMMALYVFPDDTVEKTKERVRKYKNSHEFQHDTMSTLNSQVIKRSMTEFTYRGLEQIDKNKAYLYVSNHRDIMLDSSLLQYVLDKNGYDTTEITFGANLMMNPLIVDIGKSNKMFKVERPGGSIKEFYRQETHLSEYIRYVITERQQSVWIAQRNGRTKDGKDKTDQGIIKMFCMSKREDKIGALKELNIVPVSISYEWESCDILKTLELYESQFANYTKKPGEDLTSILTGITQEKGRVHIEICKPIEPEELDKYENLTNNEYHKEVAKLIDSRIDGEYRLYPTNYIAYDILHGTQKHKNRYTKEEKDKFIERLQQLERYDTCDIEKLKDIFLGIYSNPVDNKLK